MRTRTEVSCCRLFRLHASLLLLLPSAPAMAQQELLVLLPPDGAAVDWFGLSVSLDGGLALVGAPGDDETGSDSGSAHLFDATNGEWLSKLAPTDGATSDAFGSSVSLSGGLALVGAAQDDDNGSSSGSAYLFEANTGRELFKLLPTGGTPSARFGHGVAIDGRLALVGAPQAPGNGTNCGSAYVFDANTGQELLELVPSDGTAGDEFGTGVAIDFSMGLALVGMPQDDFHGQSSGAAYLFDLATGLELLKLRASNGAAHAEFGLSVALDDGLALVGAKGDDTGYLYDVATGQELFRLTPSDGGGKFFGCSVSLDGGLALAGAVKDPVNGPVSGSAYLHDAILGQQIDKLLPSDGAPWDQFGLSVSLDDGLALVGAHLEDSAGTDSGTAYVFVVNEPGNSVGNGDTACPCGNDNDGSEGVAGCASGVSGGGATLRASGTPSVAADDLILHACSQEAGNFMLWFQAAGVAGHGIGLGDGLRIAVGSPEVRLTVQQLNGNLGTPGCASTRGLSLVTEGNIVPGQFVCYQTWYRDSSGLPCGNEFNTSNGYTITWTP